MSGRPAKVLAQHLAHARPEKPEPFAVQDGGSVEFQNTYRDKMSQWELCCLMVMDALEYGDKDFNRGAFLQSIDVQFMEDERTRAGDPPVDAERGL